MPQLRCAALTYNPPQPPRANMASDRQPENPVDSSSAEQGQVTAILSAAHGDGGLQREDLDRLFGLIYVELRRIAARTLGPGQGATLNPTALVHEAYAKLIGGNPLDIEGRRHFLALCARVMRQIVIDHARGRCADKRGGGAAALELDENDPLDLSRPESLLALDRALERLETRDPRLVQLLHYRVFAGLELAEIAPLLQVTVRQLQRDWQRARIWLIDEMLDTDEG